MGKSSDIVESHNFLLPFGDSIASSFSLYLLSFFSHYSVFKVQMRVPVLLFGKNQISISKPFPAWTLKSAFCGPVRPSSKRTYTLTHPLRPVNSHFLVFYFFIPSRSSGSEHLRYPSPDPLSHQSFAFLVGSSGLEPPTSRLSGARSNRLSYEPASLRCSISSAVPHFLFLFGGDEQTRTVDPLLARQVLSQLSYTPTSFSPSGSAGGARCTPKIKQRNGQKKALTLGFCETSVPRSP